MNVKSITITGYKPHELNIFSDQDEKLVLSKSFKKKAS